MLKKIIFFLVFAVSMSAVTVEWGGLWHLQDSVPAYSLFDPIPFDNVKPHKHNYQWLNGDGKFFSSSTANVTIPPDEQATFRIVVENLAVDFPVLNGKTALNYVVFYGLDDGPTQRFPLSVSGEQELVEGDNNVFVLDNFGGLSDKKYWISVCWILKTATNQPPVQGARATVKMIIE